MNRQSPVSEGRGVSDRMPGNYVSPVGRAETAATKSCPMVRYPFPDEDLLLQFHQHGYPAGGDGTAGRTVRIFSLRIDTVPALAPRGLET